MTTLYCSAGLFLTKSYYKFTFWFGEGLPKVVADDYKKELETTPLLPPKQP